MKTFYCLFEQSGTFKNAFKELGHKAFDFDIQDEYGETDFECDLFNYHIIHDVICKAKKQKATLIMFFPCTYFSDQQILWTRGINNSQKNWSDREKLTRSNFNIRKAAQYYETLCLWIDLCISEKIPLIIENPYSPNSFLVRYLPIKPTIVDKDRRRLGDKYQKPTMWYFINRKANDNFELLNTYLFSNEKIQHTTYGRERSEITSNYATNFIKTFIL